MSVAPAPAPTASADEERPRRLRIPGPGLVFAAIVALIVGLGAPSVAVAATPETQLTVACAQKSNGLLRVATSSSDCRPKQETPVSIWPGPTQLCIQPDGSVRRLSSAKTCTGTKPPGTIITVPTSTPVYFCAPSSGVLRRVSGPGLCATTETAYVIVNHAPSDILLSNASVLENEPVGTTVGTLSITDVDPASTPSFLFVPGPGSDDNASFSIAGTTLTTSAAFDYEADASYSIRVHARDGYGGTIDDVFAITIDDVVEDVPPTAADDEDTVAEDAVATTIDVLANDANDDGGPMTIDSVTQPAQGAVVIAGDAASVTYKPAVNACNDPPGTTTDDFTYTLAPGGSTATVAITVTCVDDLAAVDDDVYTVAEDADATAIDVLANDEDVDSATPVIASASDADHGTVVLTGGSLGAHTGLTYQPDPDYCNDPPGSTTDDFSYTVTDGGTATVSVTVTCVNDAPIAGDDAFSSSNSAVGNTTFVVDAPGDGPPTATGPRKTVSANLLADDA
ncbi:MAG: Ig-like domain-containing protein, partial [Ilumatobacteraceae bacterium]